MVPDHSAATAYTSVQEDNLIHLYSVMMSRAIQRREKQAFIVTCP